MNEIISSQTRPTAAKAAFFERLIRTAKAVRFHAGWSSTRTPVRNHAGCSGPGIPVRNHAGWDPGTPVRNHAGWSGPGIRMRFHSLVNVILSGGSGCETRSERRTYAFPAQRVPALEAQALTPTPLTSVEAEGFSSDARTRVEAQGFSHAKSLPRKRRALAPVAAFAVFLTVAGCSSEPRTVAAVPETVRGLQLLTVQRTTVPDTLEAVGTLQAAQASQMSAQIMSNIVQMRVKEGDRVRRGQVLAVLEDAQPQAAVAQATAAESAAQQEIAAADSDYGLAHATFRRYQELYSKKSVSPQEFDEVKAREQAATARRALAQAGLAQAQAALAQARTTLGYTRVLAPFGGVVTERRADPGTLASPGMALLVVEDQRRFRLEVSVDEGNIRLVKLGQAVPVTLDSLPDAQFSGRVAQVVPAADPASRSFTLKVELPPDSRLRSGLFGRAHIARGQRQAILLPRGAVIERGQLQGVYVVGEGGVAGLRYITRGSPVGEQVEALSGLQGGERIVAAPGEQELGGKRVEAN